MTGRWLAGGGVAVVMTAIILAADAGRGIAAEDGVEGVQVGAYDPYGDLSERSSVVIEHIYIPWQDVDLGSIAGADAYASERGRMLLATVEPWSWDPKRVPTADELRAGLGDGRYDDRIRRICRVLADAKSDVVIRWAHEMDQRITHYPWAGWEPADYVEGYRHFVATCRSVSDELAFMWSPLGTPDPWVGSPYDMLSYYPGDDVVDIVGVTVLGSQRYDRIVYGGGQGFMERFRPVYESVVGLGKPIWIAELGWLGDTQYAETWRSEVDRAGQVFDALEAIVYFNSEDVVEWPEGVGVPDWRDGMAL
jgi:endoglucanase